MAALHNPNQNNLLAALPAAEFERLSPYLELVHMPFGGVYNESGSRLSHVYFPTTSLVSMHYVMENGASAEIAGVGNEGMLGISLFMGGNPTHSHTYVRAAGYGYRLKAQLLQEECNRNGALQRLLLRYSQALMMQTTQTAACNRHHSVEQRLCRWLLLTLDRFPANELPLTPERVAGMLGASREEITAVFGKLQRAGFICELRGRITVFDRSGLEDHACKCYDVVKAEFKHLLENAEQKPAITRAWPRADARIFFQRDSCTP